SPQFQRLRYLKQLGTAYFVFPGATHNRFEHSIGVAHLAKQLVEHLRHHQPSLQITDRDVKCVTVAGLLHDLGHGPFSHLWDTAFIPTARPDIKWVHEDASLMMFDFLVKDNNIDIAQDDINFIKDLIKGELKYSRGRDEKPFLFEIVANQRNGIDVDKFDYIARDSKAFPPPFNRIPDPDLRSSGRLIGSARVVDNQICYNYKDTTTVLEMFGSRFALHRKIYNHRVAKAIDLMYIDALLAADEYLDIASRIDNPERYQYLTDDIILEIERSTAPELAKSRDIIRRVRKRQFYAEVDQVYIPWAAGKRWEKELTAEKIFQQYQALDATCNKEDDDVHTHEDEALKVEDILIHHGPLHWGRGSNNPIQNVRFYSKRNAHEALLAKTELVTHVLPKRFGEIQVRIYTKNVGRHFGLLQEAYRAVSR
ncbi:HD-domain/PDEase-like protein, partial [Sistotremastrum niveocremeum HHB9708]